MVYQECCEADEDGPVSAEWISRWCTCSGGKLHKRLKKDANRAAQETAQEAYRVAENNIESIIETLEKICDWKQSRVSPVMVWSMWYIHPHGQTWPGERKNTADVNFSAGRETTNKYCCPSWAIEKTTRRIGRWRKCPNGWRRSCGN